MPIDFQTIEQYSFELADSHLYAQWLQEVTQQENSQLAELTYIFCTDSYLHQMNVEYLQHDTFTDVITFDYTESQQAISGDVFISVERVQENAAHYQSTPGEELRRVMVHGLLHLLGYKDKSEEEKKQMRTKEDQYLRLFPQTS